MRKTVKDLLKALMPLAALLFGCAQQGSPSGGPPDTMPPTVEQFVPAHQSVKVPLRPVLTLKWSEWINRPSFEKGFLINPPNVGNPHFHWKGRTVEITLDSGLAANTTYSISIASGVKDLHGVSLGRPISWSFSTGDSLARGMIEGRLIGPARNPLICAYHVAANDSGFAPGSRRADYITTADEAGRFRFSFLNQGMYRVAAFEDENGDRMPQVPQERVAVASRDCPAESDSVSHPVYLRLVRMDTLGFAVVSVRGVSPHELRVRFNRPIDVAQSLRKELIRLVLPDSLKDTLAVLGSGLADTDSELVVHTGAQKASRYRASLAGLRDVAGESLAIDTAVFSTSLTVDTLAPRIAKINPPQGAILATDSLELVFSKSVVLYPTKVQLVDSAGIALPVRVRARGYMRAIVESDSIRPGCTYRVRFEPCAIADLSRNMLRDTLWQSFTVAGEEDVTKTITGGIISADPAPTIVTWTHMETQRRFQYSFNADTMEIAGLPAGHYLVSAFKDQNRDRTYNPGTLVPFFTFSEPQVAFPDTLSLRPRWEFEGVTLRFEQ